MISRFRILFFVVFAALAADQVTKYLAVSHLTRALDGRSGLERLTGFFSEKNLDNRPAVPGAQSKAVRSVPVVDGFWSHRYVENPGAAWGLLATLPDSVRKPFFHIVSLLALGFIGWMFLRLEEDQRLLQVSLALLTGGALGNFMDRLTRGYVIDFIDWHWGADPRLRWPTFNVADVAICVGVALMLIDTLRAPRAEPSLGGPGTPEPSTGA